MWSPARVFNLALLIYKGFSITGSCSAAARGAAIRELHNPLELLWLLQADLGTKNEDFVFNS